MALPGSVDEGVRDSEGRPVTLRFGVVPTNGRPCSREAVAALLPQVTHLCVIEAGSNPVPQEYPDTVTVLVDDTRVMNISKWWNMGLDWAQGVATALGHIAWDVAIINDDVVVPDGWVDFIAANLRPLGCLVGCTGGMTTTPIIHRKAGPVDLRTRLQGFAFVMTGESGLRAHEGMRWYFSDDYLDWNAREHGGVVMLPGKHVLHKHPNEQMTPTLQVYSSEDAVAFKKHWGMMPW